MGTGKTIMGMAELFQAGHDQGVALVTDFSTSLLSDKRSSPAWLLVPEVNGRARETSLDREESGLFFSS